MGRPRKIDRDKVLDAAEAVVGDVGAAALSIDAVAKAAGITKSGVQYCFGTKQQLIDAMFGRWETEFTQEVAELVGPNPDPISFIRGHIEATMRTDEVENARSAVLMAALLQTPEQRQRTQDWYRERLDALDVSTNLGRRTRLAFLASEGLFILRCCGLMDVSEAEWASAYKDILDFLMPNEASAHDGLGGAGSSGTGDRPASG
ncbi:TetR/AcrR family transcriptional regulator [Roseospira marina]|uniref:TetR/AcrR family transcriptional regulator n=1 Tax=Roseospira marina TaxID=140057 RepID=A0A5M6I914_9PROT|nr:TetR/AcrR family transcriptional regulator [Roseospira marina]KAA5604239.1 TetR/AcrR family transcriptional regulator [Roseospira marina]MBB4315615.1 AcrR family transcriptional regulator [Roseospira marina]MBB5088611.1 AcrR family transcriptional regulator [Roseospira marina]